MKWSSAVRKLRELAEAAEQLAGSPVGFTMPVTQLWATREILGKPRDDLGWVTVAVVADLPAGAVPWLTKPDGAVHWENATRAAKNPITTLWRSAHAPVWNHYVDRPALFWNREDGLEEDVLDALSEGRGEDVRIPAPSPEELRARLRSDLDVSLAALRERTKTYEERRWSPGKLTPVADALWQASNGYLDLLDALAC